MSEVRVGSSKSELLHCPFCGGEAHVYKNYLWHVACERALNGCVTMSAFVTEAKAIVAWNTRAERTCRIVRASRKYVLSDGTELFDDGCSECNGYIGDGDNYCSNCGARVLRNTSKYSETDAKEACE